MRVGRGRADYYLLKKLQINPCLPSSLLSPSTKTVRSRRGPSACTDKAQDQSAARATALLPALPPCVTLPQTCTLKCLHRHNFKELSLSRTHLQAGKRGDQAGTPPHPLPLSVCGAVLLILYWCEKRGSVSFTEHQQQQDGSRGESSHHQRTHISLYN